MITDSLILWTFDWLAGPRRSYDSDDDYDNESSDGEKTASDDNDSYDDDDDDDADDPAWKPSMVKLLLSVSYVNSPNLNHYSVFMLTAFFGQLFPGRQQRLQEYQQQTE